MKKLLLFGIICYSAAFRAQNLNTAAHDFVNQPANIVAINSKCYYAERQGRSCCGNQIRIHGIGEAGQALFATSVPNTSYELNDYPIKIVKTADEKLLLLAYTSQGYGNGCYSDVFMQGVRNRLIKLDTNGVLLFDTLVPVMPNNYGFSNEQIVDIAVHANGKYYLASDHTVYSRLATVWSLSTVYNNNNLHIYSITALSNGNLLLSTEHNGAFQNIEINTSGSLVGQHAASAGIKKFEESASGNLYGLTASGAIQKYTPAFTFTNSISIPSVRLTDLTERNDSVFAVGVDTVLFNRPFYCTLSSDLSILYQSQSASKNNVPTGIAINNTGKINVVVRGSSTNTNVPFSSFFKFPINGTFYPGSDIGVESVSLNSAIFVPAYYYYYGFMYTAPAVVKLDAAVTIKNYGTDTIKSFCLNHTSNYIYCPTFFKRYYMIIPPNGTVSVQTGTLFSNIVPVNQYTTPSNTSVLMNECFFTTIPNAHSDTGIDNDAACVQFTVNYVTGIESNALSNDEIGVYPNPFSTSFTVKSTATIKQCYVYTLVGTLQRAEAVNAREATLDLAALPAGIYFVKLDTEKGTVVKKVVKE